MLIFYFSKTFNISSRSRNQALQLANGIDLPEVKAAAYDALTFRLDEKDIIWLNLTVDPRNGQYRDALDHLHQGGHIAVPTTGNAGHNL